MKGKVQWKHISWDEPEEAIFYSEEELEMIVNTLVNNREVKIIFGEGGEE